jgi:hypothetical protein
MYVDTDTEGVTESRKAVESGEVIVEGMGCRWISVGLCGA